jgi:hypothetical protein
MKKLILIFLFFFVLSNFSYAQEEDLSLGGVTEQFTVELSSRYPAPEETVSATVRSFSADLNRATITWSVNGTVVVNQIGATNFNFRVGKMGETTRMKVSIRKQEDGKILEKDFVFRPSSVDLIIEPHTTSFPFFAGKPYLTNQSSLRVFALPNLLNNQGNMISKDSLVYRWTKDGRYDETRSGYGKDYYLLGSSLLNRPFNLMVEVYDVNSPARATSSVVVNYFEPSIFFYEKNPSLGTLFNKAIAGTFELNRREVEFEAVPFSFSREAIPIYSWRMNDRVVETPTNRQFITFFNENNETGSARIGLNITIPERILQGASNSFNLLFGQQDNLTL